MPANNSIEAQLLGSVNSALQQRNGALLQSILVIEPPFSPIYQQLIASLQSNYPSSSEDSELQLKTLIRSCVPEVNESEDDEGRPVPGWRFMVSFLSTWLAFIRDVEANTDNLLATYERLSDLQQRANSALQHAIKGVLMLPTAIAYAKVFSRVAIGLDKRPDLVSAALLMTSTSDEAHRESLPERAANIIRNAFVTCLNDRNAAPGGIDKATGKPDGKKIGIYALANLCLKILFHIGKMDSCQTIFNNIQQNSPPLTAYPAAHRVTYMYYLGRYQFAVTDFYACQLVLQKAYDECPIARECMSQRRLILIHLIAANILCGRLPTPQLYTRPEAHGLHERFEPLAQCIRKGDLEAFRRITKLDLSHPNATWLCRYQIFYQLGNYCEIFVWRSIFRRVFLIAGKSGASVNSAPTVDLWTVLAAFTFYEKRALQTAAMAAADGGPGRRHISLIFSDAVNPSASAGYVDPDFEGLGLQPYVRMPDLMEIEAICGSLIMQGFLNGYMSFTAKKFAIMGAKKGGGALKAGFPKIWETVERRSGKEVLGWVTDGNRGTGVGGVVKLAGARAAGS